MTKQRIPAAAVAALGVGALTCALAVTVASPQLQVHLDGDFLRVSVLPHLGFLSGRSLDRLHDGASVALVGQLMIAPGPNSIVPLARSVARFALSYDILEEKFAVSKIGERPDSRRSASHLSAFATENWCLDNLAIERSLIPPDQPFYVQLDLRVEDARDARGIVGDSGINITQLIEVFRTPARSGQTPLRFTRGPMRLADLKKGGPG